MAWRNWYSYGEDNYIDFSENRLTQVLGQNGSGKSSIPLILEELLYGKNSKGIKKQDTPNRHVKDKHISAEIEFSVDDIDYMIILDRKSTIKLTLLKDGEDISAHTSTGTYKIIQDIIGLDFKTFTQLIYQSAKSSLEFLTATDAQRKSFLIALFSLDRYVKIHELFKEEYKQCSKTVQSLTGSYNTINKWVEQHSKQTLEVQDSVPVPELPESDIKVISELEHELNNIDSINNKRRTNNKYQELLQNIDMSQLSAVIQKPDSAQPLVSKRDIIKAEKGKVVKTLNELNRLTELQHTSTCPTCKQEIDMQIISQMISECTEEINKADENLQQIESKLQEAATANRAWKAHIAATEEFEKLTAIIDKSLPSEIIDEQEIRSKIATLNADIQKTKRAINIATQKNAEVNAHNSKVEVIKQQLESYKKELLEVETKLQESNSILNKLAILRDSFSTSGLVSYKIEYLVKDLEEIINKYLSELSDGRFQLSFTLKGDKLNIEIIDNGNTISISALSSGELARVNTATLLAIRNLMSSISNTKINLLFLDEIMGVLDAHGKDKLVEVLLEEQDLNTFVVSHEYTHPLIEKISIIKEGDISRVEYG